MHLVDALTPTEAEWKASVDSAPAAAAAGIETTNTPNYKHQAPLTKVNTPAAVARKWGEAKRTGQVATTAETAVAAAATAAAAAALQDVMETGLGMNFGYLQAPHNTMNMNPAKEWKVGQVERTGWEATTSAAADSEQRLMGSVAWVALVEVAMRRHLEIAWAGGGRGSGAGRSGSAAML